MSTYQPPGGSPPEGAPTYPQPQDPWANGQDHGLASVPTDPIPQQYDPYAHGTDGAMWSQATVAHGGQPDHIAGPPPRSRASVIAVVCLAVVILGGGGGFAAWYITKHRPRTPQPQATGTQTVSPSVSSTPTFDPHRFAKGDCIRNTGTTKDPQMVPAPGCAKGTYKVIKVQAGYGIKENAAGKFDADTTSIDSCGGTDFESWYGYKDGSDDSRDLFFCLTDN